MAEKNLFLLIVPPSGDKDAWVAKTIRFEDAKKASEAIVRQVMAQNGEDDGLRIFEGDLTIGTEVFVLDEREIDPQLAVKTLNEDQMAFGQLVKAHMVIEATAKNKKKKQDK